jgi:glycosyltransferase involved in cell wall biosynthesis
MPADEHCPRLSVIIPCYNASATIGRQLGTLSHQACEHPWEVIVVDNGSTDDSLTVVNQYKGSLPNLRLIDGSDRRGQAHARNVGAQAALGDMLAFVDADDEVGHGWIAAMCDALSKHQFVACRIDTARLNPPWLSKAMGKPQEDSVQRISFPPFLAHAGGGTLGIRRCLHQQINGFDESLSTREDTDYCFRLQLAGIELHFASEAVIHCRSRDTLAGIFRQARLWGEHGVLVYKNLQQRTGTGLRHPWKLHIKLWRGLLRRIPQVRHKEGRAIWIRSLGFQVGRLLGSIRHRTPPVPL